VDEAVDEAVHKCGGRGITAPQLWTAVWMTKNLEFAQVKPLRRVLIWL
jgi:hypothetical protein